MLDGRRKSTKSHEQLFNSIRSEIVRALVLSIHEYLKAKSNAIYEIKLVNNSFMTNSHRRFSARVK